MAPGQSQESPRRMGLPEKEGGDCRGEEPEDAENMYLGHLKAGTVALHRQMLGESLK